MSPEDTTAPAEEPTPANSDGEREHYDTSHMPPPDFVLEKDTSGFVGEESFTLPQVDPVRHSRFFATAEQENAFLLAFPREILGLWAKNDQIAFVVVHPDNELAVKELFAQAVMGDPSMNPAIVNIIAAEMQAIQFIPDENMPTMQIVTLREHIALKETQFIKTWALGTGLYQYLSTNEVPFHPSTEELRLAYLLMEAIPRALQNDPGRSVLRASASQIQMAR